MILGIQVNEGYMTAFAGISGAFITIVGTSFNSYFKDRASEKSAYTHNEKTGPDSGNSQEPSIDNGNPIRSFVLPKKMPLLQTKWFRGSPDDYGNQGTTIAIIDTTTDQKNSRKTKSNMNGRLDREQYRFPKF